ILYVITVINRGIVTDSFALDVQSVWETSLSATTLADLAPGESATVTVTVLVPAGAAPGESDTITVTATSLTNPAVASMTILTGMAEDVSGQAEPTIYLPVISLGLAQ